ncbi:MAG: cellulase family glycosylhydrolase [Proteobacteria bacterium]|nr:cellulase family glycosylhydrolase [Pseudomonadota bacterium]
MKTARILSLFLALLWLAACNQDGTLSPIYDDDSDSNFDTQPPPVDTNPTNNNNGFDTNYTNPDTDPPPVPSDNPDTSTPINTDPPPPSDSDTNTIDLPGAGWLYVSGNEIKRDDGDGNPSNDPTIILHGVSMIDIATVAYHGGYQAQIDKLNGWNVNVIRMPVYPHDSLHGDVMAIEGWSASNANTLVNNYLQPAIDYAKGKGMYVIVDLHYINDISANSGFDRTAKAFWNDMAPRWANDPKVIYEVFNEPIKINGSDKWEDWHPIAQSYVDIIRTHAPKNLVLVGGPNWSQVIGRAGTMPVVGGSIAYVAHIYDFHYRDGVGSTIEEQIHYCHLKHPVVLTEWGFGGSDTTNANRIKSFIKDRGLSFTAWCLHNAWGPPMFSGGSSSNPSSWSPNTFGNFVKDFLAEY